MSTAAEGAAMAPCACNCDCGGLSDVRADIVLSEDAAAYLRCAECHAAGHVRRPATAPRDLAPGQTRTVGERTGRTITVTKIEVDPEDAAWDAEVAAKELARHRAAMREKFRRDFGEDATATLDDATPGQAEAYRMMRRWVQDPDRNQVAPIVTIVSPGNGTGKTRLAAAALGALIAAEPSLRAYARVHWRDLAAAWWASNDEERARGSVALRAASASVPLYIDDLSGKTMSQQQGEGLAELLEDRRRRGLPTIITANLPLDGTWVPDREACTKPWSRLARGVTVLVRETEDLRQAVGAAVTARYAD